MGNSTMILDGAGAPVMRATQSMSKTTTAHMANNSGSEKYGTGAPRVRPSPQTSSTTSSSGSKK
jgi:hypothetical protein